MRFLFFVIIITALPFSLISQDSTKVTANLKNLDLGIISSSQRSYMTFTQGIGKNEYKERVSDLEPLVFEGRVSPNYYIRLSKGSNFAFSFTPTITVRMFNEESNPIFSPSFQPSFTAYHILGDLNLNESRFSGPFGLYKGTSVYESLSFTHHSNGQNEPFLNSNGEINFNKGNFSTDFFTYKFHWTNFIQDSTMNLVATGFIGYEQHVKFFTREKKLGDNYYFNKLSLYNSFIYEDPKFEFLNKSILQYSIASYFKGSLKNPRFSFDALYGIKIFEGMDFFLFTRFYIGPDYYNSRYVLNRRALTFGILTDPFSFSVFNK